MKTTKTFIEYLFLQLLENSNSDELPLYFSDSLKDIIKEIEEDTGNEIATRLLWEEGKKSKKVFIDIDKNSNDKITFLISNKVYDLIDKDSNLRNMNYDDYNKIWFAKQRGSMKINRFINDLFNNEYKSEKLSDEQKNITNNIILKHMVKF